MSEGTRCRRLSSGKDIHKEKQGELIAKSNLSPGKGVETGAGFIY